MPLQPMTKVAYHVLFGPASMYLTDADAACQRFPLEWKATPWTTDEQRSAREAAGLPADPLSDAHMEELTEDAKRRAEAQKLIEDHDRAAAELAAKTAAVDQARALLNQPPPQVLPAIAPGMVKTPAQIAAESLDQLNADVSGRPPDNAGNMAMPNARQIAADKARQDALDAEQGKGKGKGKGKDD